MTESPTKLVRYVYLDIVGFTRDRSVEAQTDVINTLNAVVRASLAKCSIPAPSAIYLPTGDGMGIAILDETPRYDIHLALGLEILAAIENHNQGTPDAMRKFEIRIGLNQNVDNIINDINGATNVAGAGINEAQRIMNVADPSQLMVGQAVFDTLRQRERYMKSFRMHTVKIKHDATISVYQYVGEHTGLSTDVPLDLAPKVQAPTKLNRLNAYYLAYAFAHNDFLLKCNTNSSTSYALIILLWFLSVDALEDEEATIYNKAAKKLYGKGQIPLEEVVAYYCQIDYWIQFQLAAFIIGKIAQIVGMSEWSHYPGCVFFNSAARDKLRNDHPDIWEKFGLEGPR